MPWLLSIFTSPDFFPEHEKMKFNFRSFNEGLPGLKRASTPGRSFFLTSPTCWEGNAWLATSRSYSFRSPCDIQRSSEALKTRTTPSLHPLTISLFGILDTVQTEIAGWAMIWEHSPSTRFTSILFVGGENHNTHPSRRGQYDPRPQR